jgi:hypothetical protein
MSDRILVDLNTQAERKSAMRELCDLSVNVLQRGNFELPRYVQSGIDGDAFLFQISCLLIDFPSLIHYIFDAYPNLQLCRYVGRINGCEGVVNHARYDPAAVSNIQTDIFGPKLFEVTV